MLSCSLNNMMFSSPWYAILRLYAHLIYSTTRMWADAQRDGRPGECRWRRLRKFRNSIPCTMGPRRKPATGVSCSNAANIGERKTWTQSEFCSWRNSVRGQEPPKCIYSVAAQETAKHRAKFGWPPVNDVAAVTKPRRKTG